MQRLQKIEERWEGFHSLFGMRTRGDEDDMRGVCPRDGNAAATGVVLKLRKLVSLNVGDVAVAVVVVLSDMDVARGRGMVG